jgi:hypothetical protein
MVSPSINSSVYELMSGSIFPAPSLSFLPKQVQGNALLLFPLLIASLCFKWQGLGILTGWEDVWVCRERTLVGYP